MSATGRGAKTGHVRDPDDFYRTPAWATRAMMRTVDLPRAFCATDTVIDPCCGDGAILDVFAVDHPGALRLGIEIDAGRAQSAAAKHQRVICADALGPLPWGDRDASVVTNPPFRLAMEFVERSLAEVDGSVVMLLRLSWLASQSRARFIRANTPSIYVLPRRPSFAMFVRCDGCSWRVTLPSDAERPRRCDECGAAVKIATSDSSDYAWFVWRDQRGQGRVHILDTDGAS